MGESFPIIVEIDPSPAAAGARRVEAVLATVESRAARAGKKIGQSLGEGFRAGSGGAGGDAIAASLTKATSNAEHFSSVVLSTTRAAKGAAGDMIVSWDGLTNSTKKTSAAVQQLAGAFTLAAGAAAAIQIGKFAMESSDSVTRMENRLRAVGVAEEYVSGTSEQLYDMANRLKMNWGDVGQVYGRVALATKELGISSYRTFQFVESLGEAVKLSGAGAAEANAAMIQLSQGLASGTLRGEELNSVLEQLPYVADIIAKSLYVTRGELRALGQEGKITAEDINFAFQVSAEEIAANHQKLKPTFEDVWTTFKNGAANAADAAVGYIGSAVDTMTGFFRQLAGEGEKTTRYMAFYEAEKLVEASMGRFARARGIAQVGQLEQIIDPKKIREQQAAAKAAEAANEAWMKSLEGVLGQAYPLKTATMDLYNQQTILNEAVSRGKLTADNAADAYNRLWRAYLGLDQPGALGKLSAQKKHGLYGGANMLGDLARGSSFGPDVAGQSGTMSAFNSKHIEAKSIAEPLTEGARLAADAWNAAGQEMGNAIQEFVRTGKFSMNDFIGGLLNQLTQIGVQGLGHSVGLPGYATGGAFTVLDENWSEMSETNGTRGTPMIIAYATRGAYKARFLIL